MNEAAEQALSNFQHEQALSTAHAKRAEGYLAQFLSLVGQKVADRPTGMTVRCVREWTRYLAENGPELKPVIAEETGIKFSERGTPHTFLWDESMADDPDDALPPNAICRIQGPPNEGRGRPPMVYFLWSQRYDVHPLFGVGPIKPEPSDDLGQRYFDTVTAPIDLTEEDEAVIDDLLGNSVHSQRCGSITQWDDLHAPLFDAMVAADSKPTDEQKQTLRDTLPDGAEPNAAIAMAYRAAVQRAQGQALTGVIQPPDFTGQEVVGSHNHVPHIFGPLCQVSNCRPT